MTFEKTISDLTNVFDTRQESPRSLLDQKLKDLQTDNSKRLEEIRVTVDEKIQGTLEKRLTESLRTKFY
jgi:DNA recombination protein RmuC